MTTGMIRESSNFVNIYLKSSHFSLSHSHNCSSSHPLIQFVPTKGMASYLASFFSVFELPIIMFMIGTRTIIFIIHVNVLTLNCNLAR